MTASALPGDQAIVNLHVAVEPAVAFEVFTTEIDRWWRRGVKFRVAGRRPGALQLEPHVGGRLFESYDTVAGTRLAEIGRVTVWQPPSRLVFIWRAANFVAGEQTEVEVRFDPIKRGTATSLTLIHRGWASIRPDHPARHGDDVPTFIRNMGLWWGDLMSSLREHLTTRA